MAALFRHSVQRRWAARLFSLADALPSLPSADSLLPAFVRAFRRYYAIVRLPKNVHVGRTAQGLRQPARGLSATGVPGVSRFSRLEFPRMPRVSDPAGSQADFSVRLPRCGLPPSEKDVGTLEDKTISGLNTWPTCAPVNASPAPLRLPAHDSGSEWVATPSLYGSFIRYSKPVLTGAFLPTPLRRGPLCAAPGRSASQRLRWR